MADIQIEASAGSTLYSRTLQGGVFWTSPTVGYVVYPNSGNDLVYRKTDDGGATWSGITFIAVANIAGYSCWADWQTAGDAGTKIHIAYISQDAEEVRYVYLDTSDDSVGGDDLIETCQGTGTFFDVTINFSYFMISITKTRGGNFAVAVKYQDSDYTLFHSFYTSPDADTWTSKTSPYEVYLDLCLLFPGNEADNQDVWGIYWDADADEISLKTYDDSGNSWSEQSISGSMAENSNYLQMDGQIRLSDGHLIFAAWSQYDNAASDLMVWDINGAGSITAKTNIITDTAEYFLVSVFINQDNDDIYAVYVGGTAAGSEVAAFYQKSTDGGGSWGGQVAMQANAEDDERWISCGAVKAAWGGKFQPVWFNDDLNDLFTNTDNGISIAAAEEGVTVTPGVIAQTLTEYASILKEVTTPTTLSLVDTQFIPILKFGIIPSTLSLLDTEYAPILKELLTPATLALGTSAYIPVITISGSIFVTPITLALILAGYIPVIIIPARHRNVADDFWDWDYEPPVRVTITPLPDEIQFEEKE